MLHGDVIGEVWSTVKVETLAGSKLLVVRPHAQGAPCDDDVPDVVAVDLVGAGVGDRVIVALGRAARNALGRGNDVAIEAAVVGVIDGREMPGDPVEAISGAAAAPKKKAGGRGRKDKKTPKKKATARKAKAATKKKASPVEEDHEPDLFSIDDVEDTWNSAGDES